MSESYYIPTDWSEPHQYGAHDPNSRVAYRWCPCHVQDA